ncbi:MAG: inorganic phosphate transporter [Elusimicrobia bacterium]|nr:inorganic phosphate transporter [Elusimicrobiota bacterium]
MTLTIVLLILLALVFDFLNGFHDAANSIATIVATRVLSPKKAVMWAAFFNFIAFLVFGLHVAGTMGTGMVDIKIVTEQVIFSALVGACVWNIITWLLGLPTSSSHALMGGLIGAALVKAGVGSLIWKGILKTVAFMVISPLLGFALGLGLATMVYRLFRRATPAQVDAIFRRMQFLTASTYSLGHGGNDAQKTMGIIATLLFISGNLGGHFHVPMWVVLACNGALALGTMFGGWRIVKTMGQKMAKLKPVDGSCAEAGGAISLFVATWLGIPVSTTHTITGSIMGVGAVKRFSAVKWGVAGNIVWAWVLTIPCSAAVAALTMYITRAASN